MSSEEQNQEHVHEQEHVEDKDSIIAYLTKELDSYKRELANTQAYEQLASRELISYLIMERDAIRQALQNQS